MALYSTIRLGRLTLREDFTVSEDSDNSGRKITLTGRESMGSLGQRTRPQVEQRRDDINSLTGEFLTAVFSEKQNLNGFYTVDSSQATITTWEDHDLSMLDWQIVLWRQGVENEIDVESRLSGAITKVNDFSATGSRFHAPSVGHKAYWAGSSAPVFIDRIGSEGTMRVYRGLGVGINPRWGVALSDYEKGRVRFLDNNSLERVGVSVRSLPSGWELSNSLIRIRPINLSNGTFEVATWVSGTWRTKNWSVRFGTSPVVEYGYADYVSVIRNSFEVVTIRLTKDTAPGRAYLDFTLRRGSTFVETYLQHEFGTTLKVGLTTAEVGTGGSGYIGATSVDADGLKYILGSARTFTGDNANGAISKAATATLDALIGVQLNATAGNAASDLYAQYLGSPAEYVQGVKR